MSNHQYQPLPTEGIVPVGSYMSRYGRVWTYESEPEWVYDTVDTGHYETRYKTELECVDGVFGGLVSVEVITKAFEERNQQWRAEDNARG